MELADVGGAAGEKKGVVTLTEFCEIFDIPLATMVRAIQGGTFRSEQGLVDPFHVNANVFKGRFKRRKAKK